MSNSLLARSDTFSLLARGDILPTRADTFPGCQALGSRVSTRFPNVDLRARRVDAFTGC
jgi:hypothetical protein